MSSPLPVHRLWGARRKEAPEAVALVAGEQWLSHGELGRRVDHLAGRLRAVGVRPEVRVGVCLERSPELVVALLAVFEAGGVYVPVDPTYPRQRIRLMIQDAGVAVLLTRERWRCRLAEEALRLLCLEDGTGEEEEEGGGRDFLAPDHLSYLIFTSGSTGRPKAVGVSHRELARHCLDTCDLHRLTARDRVLQFSALGFDASLEQILPVLVAGGGVVLRPPEVWPPHLFRHRLRDFGITVVHLPPAYWRQVADHWAGRPPEPPPDPLRLVLVGGDRMPPESLAPWRRTPWGSLRLLNAYGPTEATITATLFDVPSGWEPPAGAGSVAVGRPMPGRTAHVLGRRLEPVAPGDRGELFLGGSGLARGYLGRPAATAASFLPDPFSGEAGARLYRTGDLARRPAGGDLQLLGRADEQVKIRGFRIELGEVEAALAHHPAVVEGVAVVERPGTGMEKLAAFLVAAGEPPGHGELRRFLAGRLPEPMLPATFTWVPDLPRTPSGKVDRRALAAAPMVRPELEVPFVAPRRPGEELVAALWSELLGVEEVGLHDDLFALGAHSLLATRFVTRVREALGVELPLEELFAAPTVAALAAAIEGAERGTGPPPIQPVDRGRPLPLSYQQEQVWFLEQLAPGNLAYNTQATLDLTGPLELRALERALTEVVRRHEIFRTTFHDGGERPVQRVHPPWALRLPVVDLGGIPRGRRRALAEALVARELGVPFDVGRLPLVRWRLLRRAPGEHTLIQVEHHFVHDGWSVALLLRELQALYRAFCRGEPSPLPEPPVQYGDYAVWQRHWLAGEVLERRLAYWRRGLADCPPLELPGDRPRPAVQSFRGEAPRLELPADLYRRLRAFSHQRGCTLFMTLLAAFQTLLYRYAGQTDLAVGTGVANRTVRQIEEMIGMVVNTVVLRTDLAGEPGFGELLERVRRVALGAYAHGDLPFERLVEELAPARDLSRNPLYQVMFSFHDSPVPDLELGGVTGELLERHNGSAKCDLNVVVIPRGEQGRRDQRVVILWEYAGDLFDATTMGRMLGHYRSLLEAVLTAPEERLGDLPLLSPGERHQLLVEWGPAVEHRRPAGTLYGAFAAQAAMRPEAVAVAWGRRRLSYGQVERRARELAGRLGGRGVGPEVPVGLYLDRGLELPVAILGVLAAGGAYLPIDPAYPRQRVAGMLEDCRPAVLLTERWRQGGGERLPEPAARLGIPVLPVAAAGPVAADPAVGPSPTPPIGPAGAENIGAETIGAENLAYVLFTSGSTGRPKGVPVTHGAVLRLLAVTARRFAFGADDVWTLFHSYAFDFSVWELWGALAWGARLVVVPRGVSRDPEAFHRLLVDEGVTVLNQTPSAFRQLLRVTGARAPANLRWVIFGGEKLDPQGLSLWLAAAGPGAVHRPGLVNMYGITETTVHVTHHRLGRADLRPAAGSPIGRPLADLSVHLVGPHRAAPAAVGAVGELWVGGAGLGRGYLGQPGLTAQRFVPDPWSPRPGGRLYRSGDLGRRLPTGELQFLGRADRQVKVRGHRIETGEVEAALLRHPAVREAAVLAHPDGVTHRLVACLVTAQQVSPEALRAALGQVLPEPMIPGLFLFFDALPLTPHGKVDRRALATRELPEAAGTGSGAAPRTPTEEILAGIWSQILGVAEPGVDDDFFALGGHSLSAVQVRSRVREVLGVDPPLSLLFAEPTLAGLAAALSRRRDEGAAPPSSPIRASAGRGELAAVYPLAPAQQSLWLVQQMAPESAAYHVARTLDLTGPLEVAALAAGLARLERRHSALRTTFALGENLPVQVVAAPRRRPLPVVDLGGVGEAAQSQARGLAAAGTRRPFNLVRGPLWRTVLLRLAPQRHRLVLALHHLVADAWSMEILFSDLGALYAHRCRGEDGALPPLAIQYGDFSRWQAERLAAGLAEAQLAYWRRALAGAPTVLELAGDRPRPAALSGAGALLPAGLDPETTRKLRALSRRQGATLFMTLSAAFGALLHRYTGQEDLLVGAPIAHRDRPELEPLVGFFLNTLVLRLRPAAGLPFQRLLSQVRETALAAYAHKEVPFEEVVEALGPDRSLSHGPLFQVMFILESRRPSPLSLPRLTTAAETVPTATAKFDLVFFLAEGDAGLSGYLEYSTDLFDATTVQRFLGHWRRLLAGLLEEPGRPIGRLPLLAAGEAHQLRREWGGGTPGRPATGTVMEGWRRQAAATPHRPAVAWGEEWLSYGGLAQRVGALARRLGRHGVGPEEMVGVYLERSSEVAVALLGVLAARGVYLPLDPAYPAERRALMLGDAGASVVLTHRRLAGGLEAGGRTVLDLDSEPGAGDHLLAGGSDPPLPAGSMLAYLIFTSGSSGRPKGIAMPHAPLANLVAWQLAAGGAPGPRRTLQFAPQSFDIIFQEAFSTWCAGGLLWLVDEAVRRDPAALLAFLARRRLERLFLPVGALEQLAEQAAGREGELAALTEVFAAGEQLRLTPALARLLAARPALHLHNHYGPSECHVVTAFPVSPLPAAGEGPALPPIGRPITGARPHLLDAAGGRVPAGVPGEIYLGGWVLARGYVAAPARTAAAFLPDPFADAPGGRLYRTGDLARHLPGGDLEFLGRTDHQVKVRGYRVEPGEVEAVLARHPAVVEVAVVQRRDHPGGERLVAYAVPRSGREPAVEELLARAREALPEHARPAAVELLSALPRTPGGKVDRKALAARPAPGRESYTGGGDRVLPRTATERSLAAIWAQVLGVPDPSVEDRFFDLGGHSILAVRVLSRVRSLLGVELPLRTLFEAQTIAELAIRVEAARGKGTPPARTPIPRLARQGRRRRLAAPGEG